MFERLNKVLGLRGMPRIERVEREVSAATVLPAQPVPKVASKQQLLPSYLTTAKPATTSPLRRNDRALANKDILDYRAAADSNQVIRDFTRADPNLSAAVTSYIRTGITTGYTAVARNMDGTLNPEATNILAQIITRLNVLNDYSLGFDDSLSIRSLSETWAREIFTTGAMCGELVLDQARLPAKIQPVATVQIRMFPSTDGKKLVPKQFIAGQYIDLDIPTFFMVTLDADLQEPYPISPVEPAIQAVLFGAEFLNDIRRIIKRVIHPRMIVSIDEEKFRKGVPPDVQGDAEKLSIYMNSVVADIKTAVDGLEPEEAIIVFDTFGITILDHGNTNLEKEYEVIQSMADAKLAAGAKVLPTVLGHSNGTSNTASAEVLLFMKFVEGTVWGKLNEMFSKVFTLAIRLNGQDVYVEFKFNPIDLRPENELEAFRAMKQSRILMLLSLGFITDEQASLDLAGQLPRAGMAPLSGTMFMDTKSSVPAGDGNNGASNSGSTMNQNLNSDAPKNPKSKNGGKSGN